MKRFLTKMFGSHYITPAKAKRDGAQAAGAGRWVFGLPPFQHSEPSPSDRRSPNPPQRIREYADLGARDMQGFVAEFLTRYTKLHAALRQDANAVQEIEDPETSKGLSDAVYRILMVVLCSIEIAVLAAAYAGLGEGYWVWRWAPAVLSGLTLGLLSHYCGVALRHLSKGEGNRLSHQMIVAGALTTAAGVLATAAVVRGQYFSRGVAAGMLDGVNPTLTTAVMVGVNVGAFCAAVLLSYHHCRTRREQATLDSHKAHERIASDGSKLAELIGKYEALATRERDEWHGLMRSFCTGFQNTAGGEWEWMRPENMPRIEVPNFGRIAQEYEARANSAVRAPIALEPATSTMSSGVVLLQQPQQDHASASERRAVGFAPTASAAADASAVTPTPDTTRHHVPTAIRR